MKKLIKLSGLIAIAFVLTLSACKKDDNTDDTTPTPTAYFTFAKVGNIANYTTSAVIPVLGTKTGTMKQTVLSKAGDNVYMVLTEMDLGLSALGVPSTVDTSYWFISNTELADVDDAAGTNKFMYFAKGDAVGKAYNLTDLTGTTTRTIVSTSESVSTTAGTFSTYRIKETNDADANESEYFFHNTAGMVKTNIKVNMVYSGFPITVNIEMKLDSKNF